MFNLDAWLDALEKKVDAVRFRLEKTWDVGSEGLSDGFWWLIQGVSGFMGLFFIKGVDAMVGKKSLAKWNPLYWVQKIVVVACISVMWIVAQLLITGFGLVGNLFGLRRGRVYDAKENLVSWLPLLVVGMVIPWLKLNEYATGQWILFFSYSIIVLGLNILVGITGQITLGHAAFVVIGGYFAAYLEKGGVYGYPVYPVVAIVLGGCLSAVVGTGLGFPGARVKGPYLGLITLCLMIVLQPILRSKYLSAFTGGSDGISFDVPKVPAFFHSALIPLSDGGWLYYHAFGFFVLMFMAAHVLVRRTKVGRALSSIQESEEKSSVLGVNVPFYKTFAFALSAFYAGVGGGLIANHLGFVSPDSVDPSESFHYLAALLIGGRGSFFGSVVAGAFLAYQSFITAWLSHWVKHGDQLLWAVFGGILVLMMVVAPRGIVGELSHWLYLSRFKLPLRRHHRRSPFPDYDLDEEAIAIGALPERRVPGAPEAPKAAPL